MDLSIIIPSFNTKALLQQCLDSIFASLAGSSLSFEILVVDNASTDGSQEVLKKYPHIQTIFNTKNIGFGAANNQAIRKARGEYILLLNSDIEVLDNAIEELYRCAKAHPSSFAGGKLLNKNHTAQASCGPMYSLPVVFLMLFFQGDKLGITRYSPNSVRPIDWVSGACLLGPKQAFFDVGLFDEGIFMYMEEIDFLYRAKQEGYSVYFSPTAVFIHVGAASSGTAKQPVINIYRGLIYFYRKHYSAFAQRLLLSMLQWKATFVIVFAKITGKGDLRALYEKAIREIH